MKTSELARRRIDAAANGLVSLPTRERMFRALVERDITFDGRFVVAVKTTGIFCRTTCPARKPRRENVEFFGTPREAVFAGYRACMRCKPMDDLAAARAAPAWAAKLKRRVDEKPLERLRDRDLRRLGLDPSSVRRVFVSHYGMSFQAYSRARRMGLALAAVRKESLSGGKRIKGRNMMQATLSSGYASESGFREAFEKLFGQPPRAGENVSVMASQWIETPLGSMLALADDSGLRLLDFVDRRGLERQIERVRKHLKCVIIPGPHRYLAAIERELRDYFAGRGCLGHNGQALSVPLVPGSGGTPFQRSVWDELLRIPMGQTRSYGEQAAALGNPAAVRAVARANGENFLGLVIPCHRVIGADGSMTGYGGGVWRKEWLLAHERKMASTPR